MLARYAQLVSAVRCAQRYPGFIRDFARFRALSGKDSPRFDLRWSDRYPVLNDCTAGTEFDRHYVYHPAWAARILAMTRPQRHIDISSSLAFCSIVSAFIPVAFYDYRPANLALSNLATGRADLLDLPFEDRSVPSLSCMHVVEHIGLGRYGDPLDPDGDLKAMQELQRVLAVNGSLLFVVPLGRPVICFNAHRIYSKDQVVNYFAELKLIEFALIPESSDDGGLIPNPSVEMLERQKYGCGCFWFQRIE